MATCSFGRARLLYLLGCFELQNAMAEYKYIVFGGVCVQRRPVTVAQVSRRFFASRAACVSAMAMGFNVHILDHFRGLEQVHGFCVST